MHTITKKRDLSIKSTSIRIRVDSDLKYESERILQELGLTTTEAIRLFLTQVRLQHGLPFRVELHPPSETNDDLLLPATMRQATIDTVYED